MLMPTREMLSNPLNKIIIILLLIILLPTIFFSVYEINSLSQDEETIEEIYLQQLDAILFSLNQYSDDVVSDWVNKLNYMMVKRMSEPMDSLDRDVEHFLWQNLSLEAIFMLDTAGKSFHAITDSQNFTQEDFTRSARKLAVANQDKINRLLTYKRGGYYKNEPLEDLILQDYVPVIFFLENPRSDYMLGGVLIHAPTFISEVMAPKMQAAAEERFTVSAYRENDGALVYSTFSDQDSVDLLSTARKELWMLPHNYLSISPLNKSIQDIINRRTNINLVMILVLDVVLILGIWFVIRNIRKEIKLAQTKSDFVSNVSHEIRTPLSLISMFAETLEMGRVKSEEKKKEYYQIISKESMRLANIVNRILNFSKIDAQKKKYQFQDICLNDIIKDVVYSYDFHLSSKGFQYKCHLADESLPLKADKEAVTEAMINLLDNAIKYSKDIKQIDISSGRLNGSAYLEIKDHGIGIPKEDQRNIFDKFFRVSTGAVHNTKGAGLGLTIVKHIMDSHEGSIGLESTVGHGSSFRLIFPINSNRNDENTDR